MEAVSVYVANLPMYVFCAATLSFTGVLGGARGVPQSIELKDNAACSTVQTQSAPHSQSIAVNDNVAYRTTSEKEELAYEYTKYY